MCDEKKTLKTNKKTYQKNKLKLITNTLDIPNFLSIYKIIYDINKTFDENQILTKQLLPQLKDKLIYRLLLKSKLVLGKNFWLYLTLMKH